MMKVKQIAAVLVSVLVLGGGIAAQDRGKSRAEGKVVGEDGKPLDQAVVVAVMDGFDKPFQQTKTNNKGEWRIENLAAGKWKFYFGGKEGLEEKAVDATIGESGTTEVPPVTLGKPVAQAAVLNAELQKAGEHMQTRQPGEARKIYEGILAKYPQLPADFQAQLHGAIAQSYAAENQNTQAIEHLRKGIDLDPENADLKLVLGEALLGANQREEGEKLLMSVDMAKVKDPYPFMNMIITQINEKKTDEALALLEKLLAQFPNENALYYYRGRAHLAANKLPEARADLEKFVAAAPPDARELPDAKKILEQMKDVK